MIVTLCGESYICFQDNDFDNIKPSYFSALWNDSLTGVAISIHYDGIHWELWAQPLRAAGVGLFSR